MLAVPCFAAGDSLSTVQNFVFNRDSGVVPSTMFTGVSGMDDKTYTLTPLSKGWESEWLYKFSNFTSPSDYFAFKSFISYVYIPVNMPVPLSESNILYIPDFYFILNGVGSSFGIGGFNFAFTNSETGLTKYISIRDYVSYDTASGIITVSESSIDLGVGNWVLERVVLNFSTTSAVVISPSVFSVSLSGFSFTLTSSITFSDYLTKQTQDILTNDVVPAVETLNNTMNNVNSSVEEVNTAVQSVEEAVSQGNQKLTEISETLDNMPQSVVDALESKSNEEVKEFESSFDENSGAALDEIEKVMPLMSFQDSLTTLASAFNNESRLDTLVLPRAKLPDNIGGGNVLWEEQVVPITETINKFPTVFVTLSRAVFEAGLMWAALMYLYNIITSCFGDNFDEEGHLK